MSGRSYRRIEQELMRKGIASDTIREVYSELMETEEDPEPEQIRKLLVKKGYSDSGLTKEEKIKIYAFLVRKGYSTEKIRRCMGNFDIYD